MTDASSAVHAGRAAPAAGIAWQVSGFWRFNGINSFWAVNQGLWNALYVLLAISAAITAPTQKELVVGRVVFLSARPARAYRTTRTSRTIPSCV